MPTDEPTLPAFGGLDDRFSDYERSRVVVLPVPLEKTTSYGKGTALGPAAILKASLQVELYDRELATEPFRLGIATLSPAGAGPADHDECLQELHEAVAHHMERGKFVVSLGGEHSLSLAPIRAARQLYGELGVVQFDAHADLRDVYEGTGLSHACVMRRVVELGLPTLAVGIRSLSRREAEFIAGHGLGVIWGHELARLDVERFRGFLKKLPRCVYLTFDVDFFDPGLLPATGTPEPGGASWYPTLQLLRMLFEVKQVVAMDLVELAPIAGHPSSDFTIARLAYKCMGYRAAGSR